MGFFNDLKQDLAAAVNELTEDNIDNNINDNGLSNDLSDFDNGDSFSKKKKKDKRKNESLEKEIQNILSDIDTYTPNDSDDNNIDELSNKEDADSDNLQTESVNVNDVVITETINETEEIEELKSSDEEISLKERIIRDFSLKVEDDEKVSNDVNIDIPSREDNEVMNIISKGTSVKGDIILDGPIEIDGVITGNIDSQSKVIISGEVCGNTKANEIIISNGKIHGNLDSKELIHIASQSIVIGDINAKEAVIGGAVKGNIDVNGTVVLDSTAKVLGDINCKYVRIDNGAVIEGKCSQSYADVSPSTFFENL